MQKIITIIGPESTGKSDLAVYLSGMLNAVLVKECARPYLEAIRRDYEYEDVHQIAILQTEAYLNAIGTGRDMILMDTDLEVIKVWMEHKYNTCEEWILRQIAKQKPTLYLLTDIDMEWAEDPLREHPLPEQRHYFFNIYKDIVIQSGVPFFIVSGSGIERRQNIYSKVSAFLDHCT